MKILLTKSFSFSSSYEQGSKVLGHNYELEVTVDALDESSEKILEAKVQRLVIDRIHSRDLSLQTDFLPKDVPVTDGLLLETFWRALSPAVGPAVLRRLSLKRGKGHRTCLEP